MGAGYRVPGAYLSPAQQMANYRAGERNSAPASTVRTLPGSQRPLVANTTLRSKPKKKKPVKRTPVKTVVTRAPAAKVGTESWRTPIEPMADFSVETRRQLADLYRQYAALGNSYNFKPTAYVGATAQDASDFASSANTRAGSETQAKIAAYAGQEAALQSAYAQASAAANLNRGQQLQAINTSAEQDIGRAQAQAANMGLGTGFGGLTNTYGVQNMYAGQRNQMEADTMAALNTAAQELAAGRAGVGGEIAAARALQSGRAQELQDAAYQNYMQLYNAQEDRGLSAWGTQQQGLQAAEEARISAAMAALGGQSSALEATSTLSQDWRDYLNSILQGNRTFDYNAYNDARGYGLSSGTLAETIRANNATTSADIATNQTTKDSYALETYQKYLEVTTSPLPFKTWRVQNGL
jgi:hypothetical protein